MSAPRLLYATVAAVAAAVAEADARPASTVAASLAGPGAGANAGGSMSFCVSCVAATALSTGAGACGAMALGSGPPAGSLNRSFMSPGVCCSRCRDDRRLWRAEAAAGQMHLDSLIAYARALTSCSHCCLSEVTTHWRACREILNLLHEVLIFCGK